MEDREGEDDYDSLNNGDEEEEELDNFEEEEEEEDICSLEKDVMKHSKMYPSYLIPPYHIYYSNILEWTLQRLFPTLVL